jgi:hypothetical protein
LPASADPAFVTPADDEAFLANLSTHDPLVPLPPVATATARCGEPPTDRAVARMVMTASSLTRTSAAGWSKPGFIG